MRNLIVVFIVAWVAIEGWQRFQPRSSVEAPAGPRIETRAADDALARAWRERRSDVQVEGRGTVTRILSDDNDGSRHQRFILSLATGQTLLVAHNIDLAPRVNSLQIGDTVGFFGEYEWNDRGGVIHWTHHDPQGRHVGGWLEHRGQRYE